MTILFINRVYPPAEGATGQLLAELAEALVGEGDRVTVLDVWRRSVRGRLERKQRRGKAGLVRVLRNPRRALYSVEPLETGVELSFTLPGLFLAGPAVAHVRCDRHHDRSAPATPVGANPAVVQGEQNRALGAGYLSRVGRGIGCLAAARLPGCDFFARCHLGVEAPSPRHCGWPMYEGTAGCARFAGGDGHGHSELGTCQSTRR